MKQRVMQPLLLPQEQSRWRDCLSAPVNIKPNGLSGFKRSVTIHLDGGVMGENVFAAALRANKAEPFGIVEPLNSTHFHTSTSFVNLYK